MGWRVLTLIMIVTGILIVNKAQAEITKQEQFREKQEFQHDLKKTKDGAPLTALISANKLYQIFTSSGGWTGLFFILRFSSAIL